MNVESLILDLRQGSQINLVAILFLPLCGLGATEVKSSVMVQAAAAANLK